MVQSSLRIAFGTDGRPLIASKGFYLLWAVFIISLALLSPLAAWAHECGPPSLTVSKGFGAVYTITGDELASFSVIDSGDPSIAEIEPFSIPKAKDGVFTITGLKEGTTTIKIFWQGIVTPDNPNPTSGTCSVEVTVTTSFVDRLNKLIVDEGLAQGKLSKNPPDTDAALELLVDVIEGLEKLSTDIDSNPPSRLSKIEEARVLRLLNSAKKLDEEAFIIANNTGLAIALIDDAISRKEKASFILISAEE